MGRGRSPPALSLFCYNYSPLSLSLLLALRHRNVKCIVAGGASGGPDLAFPRTFASIISFDHNATHTPHSHESEREREGRSRSFSPFALRYRRRRHRRDRVRERGREKDDQEEELHLRLQLAIFSFAFSIYFVEAVVVPSSLPSSSLPASARLFCLPLHCLL